jgi:RNA polymerase sigma-70 factor (ECF subfamily)
MDESDAAAVARACAGDTDAFRVLVDRYSRKVFRLAYRMTRNERDAEDVVQETFLRAYRRLKQFESRASFGTWIFRIAVNASLDLTRKLGRYERVEQQMPEPEGGARPLFQLPAPEPAPDRLLLSSELKHKVESVLASLSPQVRTAFVLRHYEGMSIEEIGSVLGLKGVPPRTVSTGPCRSCGRSWSRWSWRRAARPHQRVAIRKPQKQRSFP